MTAETAGSPATSDAASPSASAPDDAATGTAGEADTTRLAARSVIVVAGEARLRFLDGLLTVATHALAPGELRYGALLSPQGKILSDMMILVREDSVALDVPAEAAADLVKRLSMYKLRAAVSVEPGVEAVGVTFGSAPAAHEDPRAPGLPRRIIAEAQDLAVSEPALAGYTAARVHAGVPDAVVDFDLGDAFPHDVNMDVTGGVDFHKGCFVGQEVVSRMRHRGTARRRTVIVESDGMPLPAPGTAVTVDGRAVGRLGSSHEGTGLAVVRIDRVARRAEADGVALSVRVPDGAPFALAAP